MDAVTLSPRELEGKTFEEEPLRTKVCPQCGQELFADMDTCYGCLYDFSRSEERGVPLLPELGQEDAEGTVDSTTSWGPLPNPAEGAQRDAVAALGRLAEGPRLFIQTGDVDLTLPLLENGIEVGRDPTNGVVLHSRAVSRHHVTIVPCDGGAVVRDQGATNPAILKGREVRDECRMDMGDTLNICGALLTLVGVRST